ncbi:MAG: hypothetical protein LBI18_10915 [Planctomycetaceae bacterium]|jgi:hypothetical protein|nr:hypothetical protein [Planctomycetaceae bacterium]
MIKTTSSSTPSSATSNSVTTIPPPMTRRKLFRLIAYVLTGIFLIFLLILYSLYLSAQRLPDFYKKSLAVDPEIQQLRNKETLHKMGNLNNAFQKIGEPWQAVFTADDLNAYFAVELAKENANLFPKEIVEPRVTFSDRQVDLACQILRGAFSGTLHLSLGLTFPEPNRLVIRIKNARLGKLPISREIPTKFLVKAFEEKSYQVQQGTEAGDPTITVVFDLKYDNKRLILLDGITFQEDRVSLSGTTEQTKPQK